MRVPGQRRFFRWPSARQRARSELIEEWGFHRDEIVRELVADGVSPEEAARLADQRLGDPDAAIKQVTRSSTLESLSDWLRDFVGDLRFAFRLMFKSPTVPLVSIITLGLGIGANLAVFSVFNTVVLKALPYPASEQLVSVWPEKNFSVEMAEDYASGIDGLQSFAAYQGSGAKLNANGQIRSSFGAQVSPSYFETLKLAPVLGRDFVPEDALPGNEPVTIISHSLWRELFDQDPHVIGRRLNLDDVDHTIVGVMPTEHRSLRRGWNHWVPYRVEPGAHDYEDNLFLNAIGRLAPGVSGEQAQASLRRYLAVLRQDADSALSENEVQIASIMPLRNHLLGDSADTLTAMMIAAALVLLVAIANIANLCLARILARHKELAVRKAIGCDTARLGRQMLTEQLLIGVLASVVGAGIAIALNGYFSDYLAHSFSQFRGTSIEGAELGLIALLTVTVSVALGGLSLLAARRIHTIETLRSQRSSADRGQGRFNFVMLIAQTGLSVLLVVMAGVMLKSVNRLAHVDPGFETEDRYRISLQVPMSAGQETGDAEGFVAEVLARLRNLAGISDAQAINLLPLTPGNIGVFFLTPAYVIPEGERAPMANTRMVSPGYFDLMGIEIKDGRSFTDADRADGAPVAIVNQALLRKLNADHSDGLQLSWPSNDPWATVVGEVADVRQHQLTLNSAAEIYLPLAQGLWGRELEVVIASPLPLEQLRPVVRSTVEQTNPDTLMGKLEPLAKVIEESMKMRRFLASLIAGFALIALILALAGIYALTAQTLARREFEMGLRMAMGASSAQLLRGSLRTGMMPALLGCALGLVASVFAVSLIEHILFQASAVELTVVLATAALFALAALVAVLLPSLRIPRINPQQLLTPE